MKILPCLLLCALTAAVSRAAVVDIPALKDTTLYESGTGHLANGGGTFFFAGRTGQEAGFRRRGLIAFDIAAFVPAGALINSAQLTLNADKGGTDSTIVSVHRVTRDWTEGTTLSPGGEGQGGTPVLGNDATWLHATSPSVFWTGAGAAGDFNPVASSSQTVTNINQFYIWSGLEADVAAWLANSGDNFGWLLLGDEDTMSSSVRFASRDNPDADRRPILRVDFTAIPEPSVAFMAGVAMLAAVRRRR